MSRKKWTPKTEINDSLVQFREKRKWQISLRRYVLEGNKSSFYAPFFGLDIKKFRLWIETQFDEDLHWDNFSRAWQFDHIVPVTYFDFTDEEDLRLCWNFVNIRIQKIERDKLPGSKIDVLAAKRYFEVLFERTGYEVCRRMVEKIVRIETTQIAGNEPVESFIVQNKDYIDAIASFSASDFERLNAGQEWKSILYEKEFLKKFGG
jgi:hypothetical protein